MRILCVMLGIALAAVGACMLIVFSQLEPRLASIGLFLMLLGPYSLYVYYEYYTRQKAREYAAKQAAIAEQERAMREIREREEAKERAEREARQLELAKQMGLKNAENLAKAGRYEEAARLYEAWGDLDKAGECRRLDRTTYVVSANVHIGKDGGINVDCPHCGASQPIKSKGTNEVTCEYCNNKYIIPQKILDLL